MSKTKRIRKNYKKKSAAQRRFKIMRMLLFSLKSASAVALIIAMAHLFVFCHDFLTQSRIFTAERIIITGIASLSEEKILAQSNISAGTNILSINLSLARKKLLAHPLIAEAQVGREMPGTIHIHIKEHEPLAVIDLGRKFLIDQEGRIYKKWSSSDPLHLPVVRGLEFSDIPVKDRTVNRHFTAVMDILTLGKRKTGILPNRLIKRIEVDKEIGLTLYASDDDSTRLRSIQMGYNNYRLKFQHLKSVILYLKEERPLYVLDSIDLNNTNRIVVNPAEIEPMPSDYKEI